MIGLPLSAGAASIVTGGHLDAPAFGYISAAEAALPGAEGPQGFEPHIHNEGGPDGAIIDGVRQETEGEFEPGDLVIQLKSTVSTNVSGTDYFWLPQRETDAAANGLPFLGIGLEELTLADWVGGTVEISLESFSGPGEFRLWQDDGFVGVVDFINTATATASFTLAAGTHTHYNWGFTDNATFGLEFGISGEHVVDGVQSASATYTFAVPEPSTALLSLIGGGFLLRRRRN